MDQSLKYDRVPVSIIAHYRDPSSFRFVHEQCRDLTSEGVFIQTAEPVSVGTLLKLKCEIEGEPKGIFAIARVISVVDRDGGDGVPGMGVKFVKLESGSAEAIKRILGLREPAAGEPAEQPLAGGPEGGEQAAVGQEAVAVAGEAADSAAENLPGQAEPTAENEPELAEQTGAGGAGPEEKAAEAVTVAGENSGEAGTVPQSERPAAGKPAVPGAPSGPAAEASARAEASQKPRAGSERELTFRERLRNAWSERPSAPPPADKSESGERETGKRARPGQTSITKNRLSNLSSLQVDEDYSVPFAWKKLVVPVAALLALGGAFLAYKKYEAARPVVPARATVKAGRVEKPAPAVKAVSPAPEPISTAPPQEQPPAPAGDSQGEAPAKEASRPSASATPEPAASAPPGAAAKTSPRSAPPGARRRDRAASRSSAKAEAKNKAPEGAGSKDSTEEPAAAAAESQPPKMYIMGPSPFEQATACVARGDNACVVRVLEGRARSERELQLLIETYRSIGNTETAYKRMADYVRLYPSASRASTYRKILERKEK